MRLDLHSGAGLVQQTVQIVATHDLTLFVSPLDMWSQRMIYSKTFAGWWTEI